MGGGASLKVVRLNQRKTKDDKTRRKKRPRIIKKRKAVSLRGRTRKVREECDCSDVFTNCISTLCLRQLLRLLNLKKIR